jgi:hypothetical protein
MRKNIPNKRETNQVATIIPNGRTIDPIGHKLYQRLPLEDPPKFTQIGIFGSKIDHLATLLPLFKRGKKNSHVMTVCARLFFAAAVVVI